MNRHIFRRMPASRRRSISVLGTLAAAGLLAVAGYAGASASSASAAPAARAAQGPGESSGLGQLSGLLPRNHLTEESAIQVNLSNETVRLPIYPGDAPDPNHPGQTEKVWYLLLDASDQGLAHDLGVNYAPKLANIGIS